MKPTYRLAAAIAFLIFSAPITAQADLADELLDSTHDLRAQADLMQETIPNWEAPVSDSWSVVGGGSPFSQQEGTIDDNTPGLDIGPASANPIASLESLDDSQ
jgi:hypothetical protein